MTDGPPTTGELGAEALVLFREVLELDAEARGRRLDQVCGGRPLLRARVEKLLESDARPGSLLDTGAANLWPLLLDDPEPVARDIGPYRILRELGRGGMGTVFLAERADGQFEKKVALKLVRRGMDTDEILERFRHERRILASLEHPNIARLYDGGATEDGRPYLVMELVVGEPVDRYCDRGRLGIPERLDLFCTICEAVQHAHQKLVVHRDLKPSNILVSGDGSPRLLDFGIAKLLAEGGDDPSLTRTGLRALTPEYAAPEQFRGEPATTATDVHALGALLYRLLTGARPFPRDPASRGPDFRVTPHRPSTACAELGRQARGEDPDPGGSEGERIAQARGTTLDRLGRVLAGDLDTIVLKALEPDPSRRYGTARELMEDIQRYRTARPIRARPPSRSYLTWSYLRRHARGVAAAALVVVSLIAGLGATLWQARQAEDERDAAQLARGHAEQVSQFLLDLFESTDPLGLRPDRTDTLPVRALIERGADRVRTELAGQPRLQADLLLVLGRVYSSLGSFGHAEELIRAAMELRAEDGTGPPGSAGAIAEAAPLALLAFAAQQQGEFPQADSLLRRVLATYDDGGLPPDSLYAASLSEHGLVLAQLGAYDEGKRVHDRALRQIADLGALGTPLHGRALTNLGNLHYDQGAYAEAETVFREVALMEDRYLPAGHPRRAATLNNLASSLHYQGKLDDPLPLYREAIRIAGDALGDLHPEVGNYLQNLATLHDDRGEYDEAAALYRASLLAHEASLGRTNVNTALLLRNLALNRYATGALGEAEVLLREALASMEDGLGPDHLYAAVTGAALGRVLLAAGRLDEAEGHMIRGLETLEAQLPPEHHLVSATRRDLGAYHTARGEFVRAEELLLSSHAALVADRGEDHYLTREARQHLKELYLAWGRTADAAAFDPVG